MVRYIARSVRFYRDTIGMTLTMTMSPPREASWLGETDDASFTTLAWYDCQFMFQTVASLAEELAEFDPDHTTLPSGTVYFHGLQPDTVRHRVAPDRIKLKRHQS